MGNIVVEQNFQPTTPTGYSRRVVHWYGSRTADVTSRFAVNFTTVDVSYPATIYTIGERILVGPYPAKVLSYDPHTQMYEVKSPVVVIVWWIFIIHWLEGYVRQTIYRLRVTAKIWRIYKPSFQSMQHPFVEIQKTKNVSLVKFYLGLLVKTFVTIACVAVLALLVSLVICAL